MIRVSRPVRVGASIVGVTTILGLAGCAGAADTTTTDTAGDTSTSGTTSSEATTSETSATTGSLYVDGTYTAEGSYRTPESVETVSVTLTVEDDIVTAVEVTGDPQARESQQYQSQFIGGIEDAVVGKSLDDLQVSRVAGSSLTSGGFNAAVDEIRSEAAA